MLRHHNKIRATLSFSSSDHKLRKAASYFCALLLATLLPVVGHARPTAVKVPIESFSRKKVGPSSLSGTLWVSKKKTDATKGKAVLLVHALGKSKGDWDEFAEKLEAEGFDVLAIDLRNRGNSTVKELVEDVQSGVVYLKSDSDVEAHKVLIVGAELGSHAAAHYASASKQMAFILDGLVALSPGAEPKDEQRISFVSAVRSIQGIPVLLVAGKGDAAAVTASAEAKKANETFCQEFIADDNGRGVGLLGSRRSSELVKRLIEFLKSPHS